MTSPTLQKIARAARRCHGGDELLLLSLAERLGPLELGRGAIVDVRPVALHHGRLLLEEQLPGRDAGLAHAGPDLDAVVVGRVAVEVAAVAVLARLRVHADPNVDVVALRGPRPA